MPKQRRAFPAELCELTEAPVALGIWTLFPAPVMLGSDLLTVLSFGIQPGGHDGGRPLVQPPVLAIPASRRRNRRRRPCRPLLPTIYEDLARLAVSTYPNASDPGGSMPGALPSVRDHPYETDVDDAGAVDAGGSERGHRRGRGQSPPTAALWQAPPPPGRTVSDLPTLSSNSGAWALVAAVNAELAALATTQSGDTPAAGAVRLVGLSTDQRHVVRRLMATGPNADTARPPALGVSTRACGGPSRADIVLINMRAAHLEALRAFKRAGLPPEVIARLSSSLLAPAAALPPRPPRLFACDECGGRFSGDSVLENAVRHIRACRGCVARLLGDDLEDWEPVIAWRW